MAASAESVFDALGKSYEDAYAHSPGLHRIIQRVLTTLPPGTKVLDVGCGTEKPVSQTLAAAGHDVSGIDISQTMVDMARKQVIKGSFEKADMRTYQPRVQFDAIFAALSLFALSHRELSLMMLKFCEWLHPGAMLVIGIIPNTETGECMDMLDIPFMGHSFKGTVCTMREWYDMIAKVGMEVEFTQMDPFQPRSPLCTKEDHCYIIAKRTTQHPLLGPYPMPTQYRGPHPLSEQAFQPFAERFSRDDFDAVLEALGKNDKILDVGSGHDELPVAIAKRHGKAYSIEPNADRNAIISNKSQVHNVEILPGTAENIPFPDNTFDAVVSMWILHYVHDLEKSLREMTRVVDPRLPHAKIVLVQGAPDNEAVNLVNQACAHLSADNKLPDHQGFLLHKASEIFREAGFTDITLRRVDVYCKFPEEDLSERCANAAEILATAWFETDPNLEKMKQELLPALKAHFAHRPDSIGDEGVILIARPGRG
ncbi:methyltransferase [Arthroderma uncinatum]|uniref:methyltransferase n=1 Tax=Arthroderma uncinatum TaxID=74035 RepID=UPI00144AE003|nr:methyltransferase [Arthroderma uncinatum]KAF3483978.1 methyltransferase [Arthroderma uncinatum]